MELAWEWAAEAAAAIIATSAAGTEVFASDTENQSLLGHCERSEAIQSLSWEGFWIASLRSQRRGW
ncbi:hypothetical protein [Bradyrhizobium guangdongense]|uniref:hypothetical protein n=1 Tax=Bradyrhizobium guangdongense TaxID=1325090 RepID=UPI0013E8D86F|nr:hypothetical protein [Bradyrhizobium guangdongense]